MKRFCKILFIILLILMFCGCEVGKSMSQEEIKVNHIVYSGNPFEEIDPEKNIQREEISIELALKLAREYLNTNVGFKQTENSEFFIREYEGKGYYLVYEKINYKSGVVGFNYMVAISKTNGEILCAWMV